MQVKKRKKDLRKWRTHIVTYLLLPWCHDPALHVGDQSFWLPIPCLLNLRLRGEITHCQVPGFQTFCVFFPTSCVTAALFTHMPSRQQDNSLPAETAASPLFGGPEMETTHPLWLFRFFSESKFLAEKLLSAHISHAGVGKKTHVKSLTLFPYLSLYYCYQTIISMYLLQLLARE